MKGFYEGCLKIEVLEPVDVFNGFEGRREGPHLSVSEASVEDGEGVCLTSSKSTSKVGTNGVSASGTSIAETGDRGSVHDGTPV